MACTQSLTFVEMSAYSSNLLNSRLSLLPFPVFCHIFPVIFLRLVLLTLIVYVLCIYFMIYLMMWYVCDIFNDMFYVIRIQWYIQSYIRWYILWYILCVCILCVWNCTEAIFSQALRGVGMVCIVDNITYS